MSCGDPEGNFVKSPCEPYQYPVLTELSAEDEIEKVCMLTYSDAEAFTQEMNKLLSAGWRLRGNVFLCSNDIYHQVMVK